MSGTDGQVDGKEERQKGVPDVSIEVGEEVQRDNQGSMTCLVGSSVVLIIYIEGPTATLTIMVRSTTSREPGPVLGIGIAYIHTYSQVIQTKTMRPVLWSVASWLHLGCIRGSADRKKLDLSSHLYRPCLCTHALSTVHLIR